MKESADYPEDDWLALSGLQHFAFCRRQWALIHIEQQWEDNYLTTAGSLEHDRAHDYSESETRGSLLIMRDLRVFSRRLGITGACDVVEFRQSDAGVPLHGRSGTWLPYPVEYKHGAPKQNGRGSPSTLRGSHVSGGDAGLCDSGRRFVLPAD